MRSLQHVIAALLVLLAIGSAVVLATEPAGALETGPVVAPTTEPAAAQATWPKVQFAVIADAHICNPYVKAGSSCRTGTQHNHRKSHLEEVGARLRKHGNAEFVVSLGDAIEDLYVWYQDLTWTTRATSRKYWKYTSGTFPAVPHYLVLGNHDIRDYLKGKIYRSRAKDEFEKWAKHYHYGTLVPEYAELRNHAPWYFVMLHSGEEVNSIKEGSCVRFSPTQLHRLKTFLGQYWVPNKSVVLFWHVSPEGEIRGHAPSYCQKTSSAYIDVLKKNSHKIKAIFTGHVHVAKAYVWNTADGSITDQASQPNTNPTKLEEIMMFTAPSTGFHNMAFPGEEDNFDYFFRVSLHPDGTLSIDNQDHIAFTVLFSEPPTQVFGKSSYTQADACFEQDNDGDGRFDDDTIDCPNGTHLGTELDYDSDRQAYTIEAELEQSCQVGNCTPGEYYAVSSAQAGETALEDLTISQRYGNCTNRTPPISELDPEPDGGGAAVVVTGPDGVARQIANATTREYTDQTSGISVVSVEQYHDSLTEAHLENVPADHEVRLYVKFRPGLTGEVLADGMGCDAETYIWLGHEDPAFAEDFALAVVDSNAPQAPTLSQPPDGASSACDSMPSFAWDPVSEAIAYQIQVDDDDDFASPEIDSEVFGTSFSPATPLAAGSHHWRVRATYYCGHGASSSSWSLKQLRCTHLPVIMREN